MILVSQNMFWHPVVMLLALLGSSYAEDTIVSLVDGVRSGLNDSSFLELN